MEFELSSLNRISSKSQQETWDLCLWVKRWSSANNPRRRFLHMTHLCIVCKFFIAPSGRQTVNKNVQTKDYDSKSQQENCLLNCFIYWLYFMWTRDGRRRNADKAFCGVFFLCRTLYNITLEFSIWKCFEISFCSLPDNKRSRRKKNLSKATKPGRVLIKLIQMKFKFFVILFFLFLSPEPEVTWKIHNWIRLELWRMKVNNKLNSNDKDRGESRN